MGFILLALSLSFITIFKVKWLYVHNGYNLKTANKVVTIENWYDVIFVTFNWPWV